MKDKFYIVELEKNLIKNFDKYLTNFPKREIELKKEILSTAYDMLKITLEANTSFNDKKRVDIQEKLIASIKYLDFLANRCYEKEIINSKKYLRFGNELEYLLRYIIKWREKTRANVG